MRHASYLQTEEESTLLVVTVSNTKTKTTLAVIWNLNNNNKKIQIKQTNTVLSKKRRVWSEWKLASCASAKLAVAF